MLLKKSFKINIFGDVIKKKSTPVDAIELFPIQTRYNISNVPLFIQCLDERPRVCKSTRIINAISLDKTHYTRVTDPFQFWFGTPPISPSLSYFESATRNVAPGVIVQLNASSFYTSFRTKLRFVRNGPDRLRTTFFPAGTVTFTRWQRHYARVIVEHLVWTRWIRPEAAPALYVRWRCNTVLDESITRTTTIIYQR